MSMLPSSIPKKRLGVTLLTSAEIPFFISLSPQICFPRL
jgi:hypothetical protein